MKTYDELIAGGTAVEIAAQIKTNTEQIKKLTEKKDATQEEIDQAFTLSDQTDALQAKHESLKKFDKMKKDNADRVKAFSSVDGPGFDNGDDEKKAVVKFKPFGTVKHIGGGTRQENEEVAYKFFQWWVASQNNPSIPNLTLKAKQFCKDHGIAQIKDLAEGANETGGALVPPEFDPMLIRLVETYGVFRANATIKAMASETLSVPRRTGGLTTYWVSEAGTITASNPTFDNVNYTAKKLATITAMSSEISEDSAISIADALAFEIALAFALAEDSAGFLGDASATYGGITGVTQKLKGLSGTIANIAGLFVGTGNAYSELLLTDFEGTASLLPQYADGPNCAWYVHRTFYYQVMLKLALAAGGVPAVEIMNGDRRGRPLFLGYPVNITQVMPKVEANSQVCALLGDLAMAATLADRRSRTIFTDPYSLSTTDQIRVRATERIDINVHDVGNASATAGLRVAGPMVGLITAAS